MNQSNLLPKIMSTQEALNVLTSGKFRELIGAVESETLDFKGTPYRLESIKEKVELAKDISALANVGGGLIVMGVGTCIVEGHPHEVAERIRSFQETMIMVRQYEDVVTQYVYPRINLEVKWVPSATDSDKGLAYISVPKSQSERKPFLTVAVLQEDDKKLANVVGFFQRKGDKVVHWSTEELHHAFKDGLRFDEHLSEIGETLGKILAQSGTARPRGISTEAVNQRIENAIEVVGLTNSISYALVGYPDTEVEITGLFESRTADVVKLINAPPELRYAGFDISTGEQSRIVNGEFRRSVLKSYKILEVGRDGMIICVAPGDENFLCWGNYNTQSFLRVNTIALLESAYLFSLFVKRVFEHREAPDCDVKIGLQIKNILQDRRYGLPKARPGSLSWQYNMDRVIAWTSEQNLSVCKSWTLKKTVPERVAYELVSELYVKFGVEHDSIPYVKEENSEKVIDVEQIRNIK